MKFYLIKFFFLVLIIVILSYYLFKNYLIDKYSFYNDYKLKKYFIPNTYRIAFVFGTRPEAIKLFPLIKELKKNKEFICIVINTGQHKEMIQQIFYSLKFDNSIDFNLNIMEKNQSLAKLTSKSISELEKLFSLIAPNAVIVQGDTTTSFSAAVSAFYQKIPIFHVEAGLRTHNLFFPFPEEFNRVSIDDISTLYFAPTDWSANNLIKEKKDINNIFITGNTVVDSLQFTLNNTSPSKKIKQLILRSKLLCMPINKCKIILLTCHRRENFFKPIYNILNAIEKILKNFKDIVIIFPFHLNPNVRQSIKNAIPNIVYDEIIKGKTIKISNYLHFNRFLIIPPLNYIDLIHLESESYFIMSDSGGIQEEAVSIGKPILVLRENTERPEAIKSGCAFLTGTSSKKIYDYASLLLLNKELYQKSSKSQYIYGKGDARIIISKIIQDYFKNNLQNSILFNDSNYNNILSQYDNDKKNELFDIVIVLCVWKRNNLERQLIQVKNQSILKNKKTNIIIFQNANHLNIDEIVNKWKQPNTFSEEVDITFIKSPIETGYFGRFIIPLISSVGSNSYFFVCDDDVIWGNRYFENMIRVVNEGSLATRNGRLISRNYREISEAFKKGGQYKQICYNEDIEYDFGGQIWAGRISWLRKAWNHIPFSIKNSEDFWLSASLKAFYNISTKIPKCPCPQKGPIVPDMCAASDKSAYTHKNAKIGDSTVDHSIRTKLIKEITINFKYQRLILSKPEYVKNIFHKYVFGNKLYNLTDSLWKEVLFWQ